MRITVVDDHPLYREGLAAVIEQVDGWSVVSEASDGPTALAAVEASTPDVVVMDLHMPGGNGIEATAEIARRWPAVRVVVLTMLEDDAALLDAVRAGARGYLVKGAGRDEIIRTITAVAEGQFVVGGKAAAILQDHLRQAPARPARAFAHLTEREHEVLELVAQGLTNGAIAERLHLSDKTVRNYLSRILSELHVTSRAAAVARARDAGLGRRPGARA